MPRVPLVPSTTNLIPWAHKVAQRIERDYAQSQIVAQTVESSIVSFVDHGVAGNGVVDDTTSIQNSFNAASGKILVIPDGTYLFSSVLTGPSNCVIISSPNAVFKPTWEPVGSARATPLITFGSNCRINYFHLYLDAGIDTIRLGVEIGDDSSIDYFKATSEDLNNNRTATGVTDIISGALLLRGDNIIVGQTRIDNFDRALGIIDSSNVVINKIRHTNTVMGIYIHGSRDVHILSGYTSGPDDPTAPNSFVHPRGIMTPGANAILLAGCSDSSFSNQVISNTLEHGIRVGTMASGTTVPNWRITFDNIQMYGTYGCGYKQDDANVFNIKKITLNNLYTEDVGHGNWFGTAGYVNWSTGTNNPLIDTDGNKVACAIRNSEYVMVTGFHNRAVSQTDSGYFGFWVERSTEVTASNIDVSSSRAAGVVVQSGSGTDANNISIKSVTSRANSLYGVWLRPVNESATWRGVSITDIDASGNTTADIKVDGRPSGASPFATTPSRIEGYAGGTIDIATAVDADSDFINDIHTSRINTSEGTFTPSLAFATPGTSSFTASTEIGRWRRSGNIIHVIISLVFTPDIGTGSGNLRIGNLPYTAKSSTINGFQVQALGSTWLSWNSRIELYASISPGNDYLEIRGMVDGNTTSPFGASNLTDLNAHTLQLVGWYEANT